nr:hypothetical protein [Paraburkholderia sp. LEh10]
MELAKALCAHCIRILEIREERLGYLKALEQFDLRFPGFTHDTHGVEVDDGVYRIACIKKP